MRVDEISGDACWAGWFLHILSKIVSAMPAL